MILGAGNLGRVAGKAQTQHRQVSQPGLPVRTPVVQRNVTCNVATGPRSAAGAAKPVQVNLRDEGFDGEQNEEGAECGQHGAGTRCCLIMFHTPVA